MRMSESLKKSKDQVYWLLEKHSKLRDSDKLLWLAYMCYFHDLNKKIGDEAYRVMLDFMKDKNIASFETIRRVRQKAQENGLFVGEKRSARIKEQQDVKKAIKEM